MARDGTMCGIGLLNPNEQLLAHDRGELVAIKGLLGERGEERGHSGFPTVENVPIPQSAETSSSPSLPWGGERTG
jgi:hypothetical protein